MAAKKAKNPGVQSGQSYADRYAEKKKKVQKASGIELWTSEIKKADKRSMADVYSKDNFKEKFTREKFVIGTPAQDKYLSNLMKATGDAGRSRTKGRAKNKRRR